MDGSNEQTEPEPATTADEDPHFLDDPDVSQAFRTMLEEFNHESDRGAVLIAADIVAAHLSIVIRELAPPELTPKRLKEMLSYPGMVSSLASRADLAFMAGFIDHTIHQSISTLRTLRNNAAHSQGGFRLKKNLEVLRKISDLGPGIAVGVNRFATETVMTPYLDGLLERGREMEAQTGRNLFPDRATVADEVLKRPDTLASLEQRTLRTELAVAIWLLLGSIAHKRKAIKAQRLAGGNEHASSGTLRFAAETEARPDR